MDEKNKMGRLVLPVVKASFDKWVRNVGREHLFDENGDMSTLFRTMIADICAVIIKLQENKDENDEPNPIMIKNLFISNLYLANEEPPRILLLVTEAEYKRAATRCELLNPVQKIIEWCSDVCSVKLNSASLRYCGFLVTPQFSVRNLRSYPHKWDYHIKGEYLFSLIAAPKRMVENALMKAEVSWPLDNGELPYVLVKIIEYQSGQSTGPSYDETVPYDYVLLLKDTFKHSFKFPSLLKELVGSLEQFIAQVEKWSPNIWLDIYDQIGWR
ncbi:hypothetical protein QOZ80_3AG0211210 [Eleusine coracana subsp. coracana]|nr:hypothetical protein QOZ80_3AG0211210 [Eleusine coracana subsp. coracana]